MRDPSNSINGNLRFVHKSTMVRNDNLLFIYCGGENRECAHMENLHQHMKFNHRDKGFDALIPLQVGNRIITRTFKLERENWKTKS